MMTAKFSDRATMHAWARRIGVSERTLSRILLRQIGMSFGRWRQQLHIFLALRRLSQGASVQSVAADLGYENGSFVTMFRKALGTSPAKYMSQRLMGSLKPSSHPVTARDGR
jgi:AraC-like DNA-binding protein